MIGRVLQVDAGLVARALFGSIGAVLTASATVAVLEEGLRVPNASAVYVLAVALVALLAGRIGAVLASALSFLAYNSLFIEPRFSLTVHDPGEWLNLTLLLVIGLLVGQLAATMRARADDAHVRELEARALAEVSRELALRTSTRDALGLVAARLREAAMLDRVWIVSEGDDGRTRVLADTKAASSAPPRAARHRVLRPATPVAEPAWSPVITSPVAARSRPNAVPGGPDDATADPEVSAPAAGRGFLRVPLAAAGRTQGSLWAVTTDSRVPGASTTRLLATAASQVGQVLEQDRLAREASEAEIARRSDALKTALLDSVSHDLRTPLASIRAAAGSLLDESVDLDAADRQASVEAIDREAAHLDGIVGNLLDLSRIESGQLRADRELYDLEDAVETTLSRSRAALAGRPLTIEVAGTPPVRIDAVFFDRVLVNLLANVARHAGPEAPVRIRAVAFDGEGAVRLTVEDGGPGVPDAALGRLFEKFYRPPGRRAGGRTGTGVGLAVVRGLAEAMGARVRARRSELGGLAVDIDLPAAPRAEIPA